MKFPSSSRILAVAVMIAAIVAGAIVVSTLVDRTRMVRALAESVAQHERDAQLIGQLQDDVRALRRQIRDLGGEPARPERRSSTTVVVQNPTPRPTVTRTVRPKPKPSKSRPPPPTPSPSRTCVASVCL